MPSKSPFKSALRTTKKSDELDEEDERIVKPDGCSD
jgi:hypothetical protein